MSAHDFLNNLHWKAWKTEVDFIVWLEGERKEARNAALEEAAKMCADRGRDLLNLSVMAGTELSKEAHHSASREARGLAAAIRSLKGE